MKPLQRILVTGATGFVGRHVVTHLLAKGHTVRCLVRRNSSTEHLRRPNVELITGGLNRSETLRQAMDGCDAVIHLAATMKGPWEEYKEASVNGTQRLLQAAVEGNVRRFVFTSSIAIYDVDAQVGKSVSEDTAWREKELSSYERSKIDTERMIQEFLLTEKQLHCVIIRPGVVYGPGGPLFPPRLGFPAGGGRYLMFGNGENRIPFVYVENLVAGIYAALTADVESGECFNIVDDQVISQNSYLNAVKHHVNPRLKILRLPVGIAGFLCKLLGFLLGLLKRPSPLRPSYVVLCTRQIMYDNARAKKKLGWEPLTSSSEGLRRTMVTFVDQQEYTKCPDYKKLQRHCVLSKPVRVALVGCGVIAKTHLDILRKIGQLDVVALCDPNLVAARNLSHAYRVPRYFSSLEECLAEEQVDVVHILTPPQTRRALSFQALDAGCHILLEKPMALNAEDARAIAQRSKERNRKVCVVHNHMYDPVMIEARRLIQSGDLGQVQYVDSWYGFNLGANAASRYMLSTAEDHWVMQLPGQLYQNLISHPLSVALDVMEDPVEIIARTTSAGVVKSMDHDELKVFLRSPRQTGVVTVSLAVNPRYQFLHVYGTKMCVFVDFLNKTFIKHSTPKMIPKAISRALMCFAGGKTMVGATMRNIMKVLLKRFTYFDGTEILYKEFYRALTENEPMPITAAEGVRTMEIMDEVWEQIGHRA